MDGVGVYSRDDLYGHPGEGASPGPTPTLDGLAAEGVLFRNAYAYPTCSPTRAATLTGRLGFRTGVGLVGGDLDVAETTLPELVASPHRNAALGKWHLGGSDADHPVDSGFDYYAGALGGGVGNYTSWSKVTNSAAGIAVTQNGYDVYATTDTIDEASAQIAAFGEVEDFFGDAVRNAARNHQEYRLALSSALRMSKKISLTRPGYLEVSCTPSCPRD